MPSSTVKREKLFSPLTLALIAGVFGIAFVILFPSQKNLLDADSASQSVGIDKTDHLDIAYLKARLASDKYSSDEVAATIVALLRNNQLDEAYSLLRQNPNLELDIQSRFILDFEIAAAEIQLSERTNVDGVSGSDFHNQLVLLLERKEFQSIDLLKRGLELTKPLENPDLTTRYFERLAVVDESEEWTLRCGEYFAQRGYPTYSSTCYSKALQDTHDADTRFHIQIGLLSQLAASGNKTLLNQMVNEFQAKNETSVAKLKQVAEAFLAVERPDAAYKTYAELATLDAKHANHWYSEAARWAEASGNPDQAIAFLESIEIEDDNARVAHEKRIQKLLLASGSREKALSRSAMRIMQNPNNPGLLKQGVNLARRLGSWQQAVEWNSALLAIKPNDIDAITTHIDLALAQADLDTAYFWATKATATDPNNPKHRKRLAQLAEWTGDPVAAQSHWELLASNSADVEALEELSRLARLNLQPGSAAEAKFWLHRSNKPKQSDIDELVELFELDGQPDLAVLALTELMTIHGESAGIYRSIGRLHKRHLNYRESLKAWESFADLVGDTNESILNRMEMHWFLNEPESAITFAEQLPGRSLGSAATDKQVLILSEIAWRYQRPALAQLVQPYIADVESSVQRHRQSTHIVKTLVNSGQQEKAIAAAADFWRQDRSADMALQGLVLALKTHRLGAADSFLDHKNDPDLMRIPEYWSAAASVYLARGDTAAAKAAYEKALSLDPRNANALSGVLWMHLGSNDRESIRQFLINHENTALGEPELWAAFAVGYLEIGLASDSVEWFERSLELVDTDYSMLLIYADALELSGMAERALQVRRYTLRKLRPILAGEIPAERDALVRQYGRLLAQYAGANEQEEWTNYLLHSETTATDFQRFWREDMAISWLMSTQRHEHAQVIMSRLHERRLQTPVWQDIAVALRNEDTKALQEIIQSDSHISIGNQILALRQLGRDDEAYALALLGIERGSTKSDRQIALDQYVSLREDRPSYTRASVDSTSIEGLGIRQSGVAVRHMFPHTKLGVSVDVVNRSFDSEDYLLTTNGESRDVAIALHYGNRLSKSRLTTGYSVSDDIDLVFAQLQHVHRSLSGKTVLGAEIAYNESVELSPELRIAGLQNRASVSLEQSIGAREFYRIQANATEITTRVARNKVARGFDARAEIGVRGGFGSNAWTTSVAAGRQIHDRVSDLPDELNIGENSSLDSVVAKESTSLSVGASLSRGGMNGNFPQTTSPRYYVNTRVGHTWPDYAFGLQLDAGAGIRILGQDELSVEFKYDRQQDSDTGTGVDFTSFGLNYQYHF